MSEQGTSRVRAFYADILGAGRLGRLDVHVAPGYLPHEPAFAVGSGLEPGTDALRQRLAAYGRVPHELARVTADGDLAFAHVRYEHEAPVAGVDVFRFAADGRISEHWNVRQPLTGDANARAERFANTLSADEEFPFDRTWVKARVATMLTELWAQGRVELVPDFYAPSYIQHNLDLPGGYQRIERMVRQDIRRYIEASGGAFPIKVHHLAADGDLACVHLSIFMAGLDRNDGARSTNVDIFRLDRHGRMVEHWDVLQIDGVALPGTGCVY
jgi:predicted SnoaL-like aldol condensation-catalyzing enzyme